MKYFLRVLSFRRCDILPPPTLVLRGGGFPVKNANAFR